MAKRKVRSGDESSEAAAAKRRAEEPKDEVEVKMDEEKGAAVARDPIATTVAIKEQAAIAVAALKQYVKENAGKSLFPEEDQALQLLLCYKKPALVNGKTQKKRIHLPHPSLDAATASFCIIMPDLDTSAKAKKDPDVDKDAREWAERIEAEHSLTDKHISKILSKRQLEREYRTFREQRRLATAYDCFLVEKTVHKSVHSFLGKEFIKAHKMPLSFDYTKSLSATMAKAAATSIFDLTAMKIRTSVHCGHLGQSLADLVENVNAVISAVLSECPGGLCNVRSLWLQQSNSRPSLPIFTDDGSASEVKLRQSKPKPSEVAIYGELSTLPDGLKVSVTRSGRVKVIQEESGLPVVYPTIKDEWELKNDLKPSINLEKVAKKRQTKLKRKEKLKKKKLGKKKGPKAEVDAFAVAAGAAKTQKTPSKTPSKSPAKTPSKPPSKTPSKTPIKTPARTLSKAAAV